MIDLNTWIYCNIFNIIHTKKKGKILFCHRVDDFSPFDRFLRWCKICTAREADYFKLWWSLGYYTFCFIFLAAIGKFAIFSYLSTCQNVCVILDLYLIFFLQAPIRYSVGWWATMIVPELMLRRAELQKWHGLSTETAILLRTGKPSVVNCKYLLLSVLFMTYKADSIGGWFDIFNDQSSTDKLNVPEFAYELHEKLTGGRGT